MMRFSCQKELIISSIHNNKSIVELMDSLKLICMEFQCFLFPGFSFLHHKISSTYCAELFSIGFYGVSILSMLEDWLAEQLFSILYSFEIITIVSGISSHVGSIFLDLDTSRHFQ